MFDLTKEIKLEPDWQKKYQWLRVLIYAVFILGFLYLGCLSFFPSARFLFSFAVPSSKNNLSNPRNSQNVIIKNGEIEKGENLTFDAFLSASEGNFSKIEVDIKLDKKSLPIQNGEISLAKSYQSFFYPLGDSVEVKAEDKPGFAGGTLISYGQSVFIVSGNEILPINSPAAFESRGFYWDDVIPVSSEEIGAYEKGKLFTADRPDPDGTIFTGKESGKYYLIQNSTKRELIGSDVIQSYLKKNPVLVDEKGLLKENSCQLKEKFGLFGKSYSCVIAIENLKQVPGNDYRFEAVFSPDIKIKEMKTAFQKTMSWSNLRSSLAEIKQRIISRYYGQPQQ